MELATKQNKPVAVPKKTISFFPKKTEAPFFSPVFIQPKLTVGPVDDIYEREADSVAESVMRMPDQSTPSAFFPGTQTISKIQRQCASCEAEERLQRMEEDEEEQVQTKPYQEFSIHRKCAECEQEETMIQPKKAIQRKCGECAEEDQAIQTKRNSLKYHQPIQRKCAACERKEHAIQPKRATAIVRRMDAAVLQRKCAAGEEQDKTVSRKKVAPYTAPQVTPSVHNVLKSAGHPIDRSTRSFMEKRFGYDFGDVRIHNDIAAHQSSKDIHALAYTHGKHVVFGAGQYQPDTPEGKKLLAHELTHVVQQGKLGCGERIRRQPKPRSYNMPVVNVQLEKYSEDIERKYRQRYNKTNYAQYLKTAQYIQNCRTEGTLCDKIITSKEFDELLSKAKDEGFESSTSSVIMRIPVGVKLKLAALFVSQLFDIKDFQEILEANGFVILNDPLQDCITGCHYLNDDNDFPVTPICAPAQAELDRGSRQEFELKGHGTFKPEGDLFTYIKYNLSIADSVLVKVRFGNIGKGTMMIFGEKKPSDLLQWRGNFNQNKNAYNCSAIDNDIWTYDAAPQLISFKPSDLDGKSQNITTPLAVEINKNEITGQLLVQEGDFASNTSTPMQMPGYKELFSKLLLGVEHASRAFESDILYNSLEAGQFGFYIHEVLESHNLQKIDARFGLRNEIASWTGKAITNIFGTDPREIELLRTPIGFISGEKDGLEFNEKWNGKNFTSGVNIHVTYVNGHLFASGKANYNSPRVKGDLFFAITNFSNAQRMALDYLPEQVAAVAKRDAKDNVPENVTEQLAFVGAGSVDLVIFDGSNKGRKHKHKNNEDYLQKPPEPTLGDDRQLKASASFVVEPEGYVTVAGNIRTDGKPFDLFKRKEYTKSKKLLDVTIASIPTPFAGANVNFNFEVTLNFGAYVGPLTISEIVIDGVYTNRPKAPQEVGLSGLIVLEGGLTAGLHAALTVKPSVLGLFDVDFLGQEIVSIDAKFSVGGKIQARPSIRIYKPKKDTSDPAVTAPEYYFEGEFNFDSSGKLEASLGDKLKFSLNKSPKNKRAVDPEKTNYIPSTVPANQDLSEKDLKVPIDHTLGSEDVPGVVVKSGKKEFLKSSLTSLITENQARPIKKTSTDKYFTQGIAGQGAIPDDNKGDYIKGGYIENRQTRGKIIKDMIQVGRDYHPIYAFTQELRMKGKPHKLHLIVEFVKQAGKPDAIKQFLMMASENEEPLTQKIQEEKAEIERVPEAKDDLQKQQVELIEQKANDLKNEVDKLAKNGEITEDKPLPQMIEVAAPIESYANGFDRDEFGTSPNNPHSVFKPTPTKGTQPSTPPVQKPKINYCPKKPDDIVPDQKVVFEDYNKKGRMTGRVIEIVLVEENNVEQWFIKFKPWHSLQATALAARAYEYKNSVCEKQYLIPLFDDQCKTGRIKSRVRYDRIPDRYLPNGQKIRGRAKAIVYGAVPLCWSDYQKPEVPIVGLDRIKKSKRWVRGHLVHGELGGEGIAINLIPISNYTNTVTFQDTYERNLLKMVQQGHKKGEYYWFRAEVEYHKPDEAKDIKYYDDFVKQVKIYYDKAHLKDGTKNEWLLDNEEDLKHTITMEYEPGYHDLETTRTEG